MSQLNSRTLSLIALALAAGAAGTLGAQLLGPTPGATARLENEDIDALRSELSDLRKQLQRQRSSPSQAAVGAQVPAGQNLPPPEATKPAPSFDKERVDAAWARATEAEVRDFLAGLNGVSVESLECRTSTCRVRFSASDMMNAQRVFADSPRELGAKSAGGGTIEGKLDTYEVTFVLPHDDEG